MDVCEEVCMYVKNGKINKKIFKKNKKINKKIYAVEQVRVDHCVVEGF